MREKRSDRGSNGERKTDIKSGGWWVLSSVHLGDFPLPDLQRQASQHALSSPQLLPQTRTRLRTRTLTLVPDAFALMSTHQNNCTRKCIS